MLCCYLLFFFFICVSSYNSLADVRVSVFRVFFPIGLNAGKPFIPYILSKRLVCVGCGFDTAAFREFIEFLSNGFSVGLLRFV